MRFLIDGYNLLHFSGLANRVRSWHSNRAALIAWLLEVLPPSIEWKIVFDAQRMGRNQPTPVQNPHVVIAKGETADDWIDAFLQREAPGSWVVVSSDRQVRASARKMRCEDWPCDRFLDWIEYRDRFQAETPKKAQPEKMEDMTELELKSLAEIFQPVPPSDRRKKGR